MSSEFRLNWYGAAVSAKIEDAVEIALEKSGLHLKSKSSKTAPKKTGDLRGNCSVVSKDAIIEPAEGGKKAEAKIPITGPNDKLAVHIGYSLPYALKQHEDLSLNHAHGKAKYLEDPFNANKDKYVKFVAREVGEAIR